MTNLTVTEARATLPWVLDRVQEGEEVTITRHGQPVAVVVRPDSLRSRRADASLAKAAEVRRLLEEARHSPLSLDTGLSIERADELVAELRADRDSSR
jgi:prevent-host-death family protein